MGLSRYFGKNDYILLSAITLFFIIFFGISALLLMKQGSTIIITVDGEVYGEYELGRDQIIPIIIEGEEKNVLRISGQKVFMEKADCPDRLCVRQGAVSKNGQSIVCLPHRVVVKVSGGTEAEFDSISR